jgi:hypothetical protein
MKNGLDRRQRTAWRCGSGAGRGLAPNIAKRKRSAQGGIKVIEPRLMTRVEAAVANPSELADDLLEGADAIATYVYGDKKHRRKVYHLAATRGIPTFNLGALVCARKSTLLEWIKAQEARSFRQSASLPKNTI